MKKAVSLGPQILCSTLPNRLGERLTKSELQKILFRMPALFPVYQEHDISLPPVGYASNPRITELQANEYGIEAEIFAYDRSQIEKLQGLSITYTHKEEGELKLYDLDIQYDERFYSADWIKAASLAIQNVPYRISNVRRNALPEAGLIVILLGNAVLNGFFEESGKLAFNGVVAFLKKLFTLPKRLLDPGQHPCFSDVIIRGKDEIQNTPCEFILKLSQAESIPSREVDRILKEAKKYFLQLLQKDEDIPIRMSIEYDTPKGSWQLIYIQKKDGSILG